MRRPFVTRAFFCALWLFQGFATGLIFGEPKVTHLLSWGRYGECDECFAAPHGIAINDNGDVYVSSFSDRLIKKFTSNGQFVLKWGGVRGKGDGEFMAPTGVAVGPRGNVYVADWEAHSVQKFDGSGVFLRRWGGEGTDPGHFIAAAPTSLAVDANGYVYVEDFQRLQKFDQNGIFTKSWGNDSIPGAYWGMATDSSSYVYIAESWTNTIKKFTSDGTLAGTWQLMSNLPAGIDVDPDGNVYLADCEQHRMTVYSPGGQVLFAWGKKGQAPGEFDCPWGVAVAPDRTLYITDRDNNRVQRFRLSDLRSSSGSEEGRKP